LSIMVWLFDIAPVGQAASHALHLLRQCSLDSLGRPLNLRGRAGASLGYPFVRRPCLRRDRRILSMYHQRSKPQQERPKLLLQSGKSEMPSPLIAKARPCQLKKDGSTILYLSKYPSSSVMAK